MPEAVPPFIKILHRGSLRAVHVGLDPQGGNLRTYPTPLFGSGEAAIVALHLRDMERVDLWRDDRQMTWRHMRIGTMQAFDLDHEWRGLLYAPCETVNFQIDTLTIDRLFERKGAGRQLINFASLDRNRTDDTMLHLARALLPVFSRAGELSALFADQIIVAAASHLLAVCGGQPPANRRIAVGGLATWQLRRAQEMLAASIEGEIRLGDLALACGLSSSHFAKAFRISTGLTPHRWLLELRLDRARELLLYTSANLSDIALACGFADQSHLTRVFGRNVGTTPAAWRRMKRS